MLRIVSSFCAVAVLLAATPALADDSSAALGAGGIVLTRAADIRMASEDLFISPTEVRVRYEFVNDGDKDVDTIVAFPLPDIDVQQFYFEPLGTTKDSTPNFMGFELTVDGKKLAAVAEERAIANGRDVTAVIRAAGLPINIVSTDLGNKIAKLPPATRKSLEAAGLVEIDGGNDIHPHWIAQTKFWWHQRFAAGKTVIIEHRYQPVTGQSFFGDEEAVGKDADKFYARTYCIDAPTRATLSAKIAARKKANPENGGYLNAYATDFVLVTANNWKGPIGKFHLTLDKLKPENVLSLCWDGDLKKTGPTTFEAARENFAPARDVKVLVLQ